MTGISVVSLGEIRDQLSDWLHGAGWDGEDYVEQDNLDDLALDIYDRIQTFFRGYLEEQGELPEPRLATDFIKD